MAHLVPSPTVEVTFVNKFVNDPHERNQDQFQRLFADRALATKFIVNPIEFRDFDIQVGHYIQMLGWGLLLHPLPLQPCPRAIRYFYANMQCSGIDSREFLTIVNGYEISLTTGCLVQLLNIPTDGIPLAEEQEMAMYNFSLTKKKDALFRRAVTPNEIIPTSSLQKFPRVLHYFITHVFLPRSQSLDVVTQLDLWVLFNALAGRKLDYSHLMFGCMIRVSSEEYTGCLPFGGYITLMLANLDIPLSGFVSEEPSITVLAALIMQHYVIPLRTSTMAEEAVLTAAQDVAARIDRGRKRRHCFSSSSPLQYAIFDEEGSEEGNDEEESSGEEADGEGFGGQH